MIVHLDFNLKVFNYFPCNGHGYNKTISHQLDHRIATACVRASLPVTRRDASHATATFTVAKRAHGQACFNSVTEAVLYMYM